MVRSVIITYRDREASRVLRCLPRAIGSRGLGLARALAAAAPNHAATAFAAFGDNIGLGNNIGFGAKAGVSWPRADGFWRASGGASCTGCSGLAWGIEATAACDCGAAVGARAAGSRVETGSDVETMESRCDASLAAATSGLKFGRECADAKVFKAEGLAGGGSVSQTSPAKPALTNTVIESR